MGRRAGGCAFAGREGPAEGKEVDKGCELGKKGKSLME